jgi:molecular chaperone DnaK
VPQIEVTFDIDANGILNVMAKDKATGKEQGVKITASTNLSKDEVERLVRDAKSHESEDKALRDLAEARNTADNLVYVTEKSLRELGDKVPATEREQIERMTEELKAAVQTEDLNDIRQKTEQLQQASHALTQQMYQQQGGPDGTAPDAGTPGTNGGAEDDVVEGEYRQV